MRKLFIFSLVLALLLASTVLAGCGADSGEHAVAMADAEDMPAHVQSAPRAVHDAYRFAAANQATLEQIPCYCGCGVMGHTSNYACFWQPDGGVDYHGLGCGICVDIAQDVRRGMEQGLPLDRIRAQVDANYSRFGPPTDTPPASRSASSVTLQSFP